MTNRHLDTVPPTPKDSKGREMSMLDVPLNRANAAKTLTVTQTNSRMSALWVEVYIRSGD